MIKKEKISSVSRVALFRRGYLGGWEVRDDRLGRLGGQGLKLGKGEWGESEKEEGEGK